jgi:hypothetical protein
VFINQEKKMQTQEGSAIARYLIEKYGSDKFRIVLEKVKQEAKQQKESAKDGKSTK